IDGTGAINSVVVDSPGSGYTSTPSLTLSSAGQTTAGALGLNGVTLTSLQLTNPGFDYNSPTISITGGSGTGATGNIAGSSTSWTLNANRGITLGVGGGGLYQTAGTTLTYGGVIGSTDPGPFTKSGAGTLTLTAPETYTGNTSVSAGTLNVASSSSLPSGTNLTANGTAHLSNAAQTIGSLNGAGSVVIDGGTALSVNGGGTFSGAISSGGSVTVGGTTALTLSGANTYTGATTVNAGATLNVSGSLAATNAVTSNGTTNFAGNTTAVTETQVLSSLAIGNGATVSITPSTFPFTPTLLKPGTTTYGSGAKIDITNNEFATTGTASGALTQIQSGQIFSSQTPDPNKAIGYIDLSGADAGKFEVRYTLKGDANLDGTVNVGDLGALATSYGLAGSWANGDFTQDGVVNVGDLGALATNYGTQLASGPSAGGGGLAASPLAIVSSGAGGGSAAVPEPSSLGLLAAAALLSQRRRRRRA
ncbi:MAG TPA: autotransporter-associated beta strand repeat-containing protein, partial [Tepidisphaeraceae bacterium]|nr:autotransporter-associated beta strand repeat-containing protein [Tepidisphaeraceae bacterium]